MYERMSIREALDRLLEDESGKVLQRIPDTPWPDNPDRDGATTRERAGDLLSYAGEGFEAMLDRCPELRDTVIEAMREAIREHWADIVGVARERGGRGCWWAGVRIGREEWLLDSLRDLLLEAGATNSCKGCVEMRPGCARDCELMDERKRAREAAPATVTTGDCIPEEVPQCATPSPA